MIATDDSDSQCCNAGHVGLPCCHGILVALVIMLAASRSLKPDRQGSGFGRVFGRAVWMRRVLAERDGIALKSSCRWCLTVWDCLGATPALAKCCS